MRRKRLQTTASTANHKRTAVIYTRVSSKEQQEEGFSLDAQHKFLMEYADKKGIEVIGCYMDVQTAKKPGRTEFNKLIEFLSRNMPSRKGERCGIVLVEKTDRFYRNIEDLTKIRALGVEVHLAKENNVMGPEVGSHDKFVHTLNVALAERMVDNLSEETQKGMQEKASQGEWPSAAPIGYLNVEGPNKKRIIVPNPDRAPLVKKVFELYATGNYSLKDLCKEAARIGLTSRSGATISKSTMDDIITNPIYYGDFFWKGLYYEGNHQPIISKDLFIKVQKVIERRTSCPTGRHKHDFLFQGMLTCGHCGCAVVAEIQKQKYIYYHCTGNRGKCPERFSREEIVEQQFISSLKALHVDNEVADYIVSIMKASAKGARVQQEKVKKDLSKKREQLETRIERIYEDKYDGGFDDEEDFKRLINKSKTELADVKMRISKMEFENCDFIDNPRRIFELLQKAASLYSMQNQDEKRKLLKLMYSNSIWANRELTPGYRKPFDLLALTNKEYVKKKPPLN